MASRLLNSAQNQGHDALSDISAQRETET